MVSYNWFSTRILKNDKTSANTQNNLRNSTSLDNNHAVQTWTTSRCRSSGVWFTLYHALCSCAVLPPVGDEGHLQELGGGAHIRAFLLAISVQNFGFYKEVSKRKSLTILTSCCPVPWWSFCPLSSLNTWNSCCWCWTRSRKSWSWDRRNLSINEYEGPQTRTLASLPVNMTYLKLGQEPVLIINKFQSSHPTKNKRSH